MPSLAAATQKTGLVIDRQSHTIKLTRDFDAPRAEIFDAWTMREHVACWWDPAGEPLTICEIDLRPGGSFKFVTKHHPDMPFAGTIVKLLRQVGSSSRRLAPLGG
ncbi:MAG: SRPBCC domain-containing protein [Roseiarcus sp.]